MTSKYDSALFFGHSRSSPTLFVRFPIAGDSIALEPEVEMKVDEPLVHYRRMCPLSGLFTHGYVVRKPVYQVHSGQ